MAPSYRKDLHCWRKGHPTTERQRLIANMVFGGRTQYLTRVQGMPKGIEWNLTRIQQSFVCNGSRSTSIGTEDRPRWAHIADDIYGRT